MPPQSDAFSRTRPLADPVRIITTLMMVSTVLLALVYSLIFVPKYGLFGLLVPVSVLSGALSCAILVGAWGRPNVIYLRAFRTDRSTAKLRAELAAILGPGFRLSGIRPPRERSSTFMRFWLPGLVALRYAGSRFMELEAGDDWMARLWKTYQTTRFVFIDARDITPYVHQEIEMTLETMGPQRSVFLVGSGATEQEIRSKIPVLSRSQSDPAVLNLLRTGEEQLDSRQLEHDLKEILKTLPAGYPGESDRGRQFVLEHVSAVQLQRGSRPSPAVVVSATIALALSVALGLLPRSLQLAYLLPMGIVGAITVIAAMIRTMARIRRSARYGYYGAAVKASLLLVLAALPFGCSVLSAAVAIPKLRAARHAADEAAAIASMRTLYASELMYSNSYPDKGYACDLPALGGDPRGGPPSPNAAQFVSPELASGKRSGYYYAIGGCTREMSEGHETVTGFHIYAVPVDGKGSGRGFCVDQSGEILVDRNGGSDCVEPLR